MMRLFSAALLLLASGAVSTHAQSQVAEQRHAQVPLRAIEERIVPQMRGFEYLGPELDPELERYRLKFMRGQQVVWIDVDARTGAIVGRSGF